MRGSQMGPLAPRDQCPHIPTPTSSATASISTSAYKRTGFFPLSQTTLHSVGRVSCYSSCLPRASCQAWCPIGPHWMDTAELMLFDSS